MTRCPCRPARLFKNRSITRRSTAAVPGYMEKPVTLLGVIIKCLLIFGGSEIAARFPGRSGLLFPDACITHRPASFMRADPCKPEALLGKLIKSFLVVRF